LLLRDETPSAGPHARCCGRGPEQSGPYPDRLVIRDSPSSPTDGDALYSTHIRFSDSVFASLSFASATIWRKGNNVSSSTVSVEKFWIESTSRFPLTQSQCEQRLLRLSPIDDKQSSSASQFLPYQDGSPSLNDSSSCNAAIERKHVPSTNKQ
jgi:hypothetical protein